MLTPEQFVRALALTESYADPEAWGDAGRAEGEWQEHPDWAWTWAHHYNLSPALNETWDSFERRIVTAFAADHLRYMTPTVVAMYFHLGHRPNEMLGDWDREYAQRFERFAGKVANA